MRDVLLKRVIKTPDRKDADCDSPKQIEEVFQEVLEGVNGEHLGVTKYENRGKAKGTVLMGE